MNILTTKDLKPQCLLFCFKLNVSEGDAGFPHSSGSLFPFFLTTVNKSFNKVSEVRLKQTYDDKFCGFEFAARAEIKNEKERPPSCGYSKELSSSKSKGIPMKSKGELYNHVMVLCVGLFLGGWGE